MSVDEQEYINNITQAASWANNLALEAGVVNKDNAEMFIIKAFNNSKGLALSENILTSETTDAILAKAEAQAKSLKAEANISDAPIAESKKDEEPAQDENTEAPAESSEPAKEVEEEEEEIEDSRDVIDHEVDMMAQKTKDHAKGPEGINKIQEVVEELKKDEMPSVDDLCKQMKQKSKAPESRDIASDEEIDKQISSLVREVKYKDVKKEEGNAEKIVDDLNASAQNNVHDSESQ